MFSDTHFHFQLMQREYGVDGLQVLKTMAENNCFFSLDVATKAEDLFSRYECWKNTVLQIEDYETAKKACNFMYFSAGVWPDMESIHDGENKLKILKQNIDKFNNEKVLFQNDRELPLQKKIIAIGEGGLDHHWNPSGVDGRCESDFDKKTYEKERELFEMQLELAKEMNLPFIIHSRDAFEDTLSCIKNIGYHNGIVHCFSYGLEEARAFLDLGWYIAFGGGITYTKKSKMEKMTELLNYVPQDRLLCETDAPFLSPVPLRGTPNSPANINYVYDFLANARKMTAEQLCGVVDKNIKDLFRI